MGKIKKSNLAIMQTLMYRFIMAHIGCIRLVRLKLAN